MLSSYFYVGVDGDGSVRNVKVRDMRVLVACEESGVVRDEFIRLGHEVLSCDLLPTRTHGPHYRGNLFDVIHYPWDMALFFTPCTDLAVSGARHFEAKKMDGRQYASVSFFMRCIKESAHISKTAFENPVGILSNLYRKPDQIIQPWQFGHGETKATCLWLKGLPKLEPTDIVEGREQRIWKMPPSADRAKERSKTYVGIARAMAEQWGGYVNQKIAI
jgi:hypothetical protein